MPLSAGLAAYISELKAYDKVPLPTPADAARAFTDAFAHFFASASLNGVPITFGTNMNPGAMEAMKGILTGAFTAPKDPVSSGELIEASLLAYLNAGHATMWPGLANSVIGKPAPANLMSNLSAIKLPGASEPKSSLANGVMNWLMSGAQAQLNAAPWTAFFV